jgi:hypothetical protein
VSLNFLVDRTQAGYDTDDPACPPANSGFDVTQRGVLRIVLGDAQVGSLEESASRAIYDHSLLIDDVVTKAVAENSPAEAVRPSQG